MKKNMFKLVCVGAFAAMLMVGCSKEVDKKEDVTTTPVVEQPVEATEPAEAAEPEENNSSVDEVEENTLSTVYPLTIDIYDVDGNKHSQTYEKAPTKAVTNNVSSTELLLELGLEESILGILKPDNAPADKWKEAYARLNILGDKKTMSKEVIIGSEPDIIIGRAMPFTDDSMGTVTDLNDMGIDVYTQLASNFVIDQSLDNIILDVRNIGKIFDVSEKANSYADELQEKLDTVKANVEKLENSNVKKVLFMVTYTDGTFNTFGANSTLQSEMLKTINAVNSLEVGTSSLTSENLVELNPDVIVYVRSDRNAETDKIAVESLLSDETIQTVTAIKDKQIIEIAYDDLMDYGVRIIDTVSTLYDFMYVK